MRSSVRVRSLAAIGKHHPFRQGDYLGVVTREVVDRCVSGRSGRVSGAKWVLLRHWIRLVVIRAAQ
jgi:hypothetical protein